MKKLFTFLLAIASFAIVHAQNTREESRRQIFGAPANNTRPREQSRTVVFGNNPNSTVYRSGTGNRTYKPTRRHYEYEHKEWKHSKKWKEHKDNGKHLGWNKGKGNPHHR